jgi:hypothetical protein
VGGGGGGESTVLFDAGNQTATLIAKTGTSTAQFAGGLSETINVGSGPNGTANLCLVAAIIFVSNSGASTPTSLIWDLTGANQAMTAIPGGTVGTDVFLYYLMNPTLGAKNLNLTWSGTVTNTVTIGLASFVSVDQTGGATSFPTVATNTGTGTVATVSISTSPTTRKIVGAFTQPSTNFTTPVNGTSIGMQSTNNLDSAITYDNGTAISMGYNMSGGGGTYEAIAVALKGA